MNCKPSKLTLDNQIRHINRDVLYEQFETKLGQWKNQESIKRAHPFMYSARLKNEDGKCGLQHHNQKKIWAFII